jgi:hypothetical protein
MSQVAIIGVVVLAMMVCSSSSAAMLMMGGGPEVGAVCTPEGTKDANATYKYNADGKCTMYCKTGYKNESGTCVKSTPPPPKAKIAISNRPRSDIIWGWTVYDGCSGEGKKISDVRFGEKPTNDARGHIDHNEGNPEVGSIILKNASVEGSYNLGNGDFTINQGVGNKLIDFCQPDGTKATKYNFTLKF